MRSIAMTFLPTCPQFFLTDNPHCTEEISSPVISEIWFSMLTFLRNSNFNLSYVLGYPEIRGSELWKKDPHVMADEKGFWIERTLAVRTKPSSCIYLNREDPAVVHGWIYPDRKDDITSLESLLDVSELEILLSGFDTVSLHSSLIRWKGEAILFSAPSGTGKSTQADLWERFRNAEILNGDRSMVRKTEQGWTAFGSPFAGSSSIYRNESAPIRAIVVLRQSPCDAVRTISGGEAFRALYSEMVIPKWHSAAHQKIIALTEQLATEVPVLWMDCTPEESAVEVLEDFLTRKL